MKYDKEFLQYVDEILKSKEFQKRKKYHHHEDKSVYDHSLEVAYKSYLYAKKHNLNCKDISIGGLLHEYLQNSSFPFTVELKNHFSKCMDLFMLKKHLKTH